MLYVSTEPYGLAYEKEEIPEETIKGFFVLGDRSEEGFEIVSGCQRTTKARPAYQKSGD